jgi:hypothetical protein
MFDRCGTIVRLVDLYQGEKGNIPPGLIIRPPKVVGHEENSVKVKTRVKMGDRDKRPNFLPLLSLLSTLIRSGNLQDESNFDVSDSDSDSSMGEKDGLGGSNLSAYSVSNKLLTKACLEACHSSNMIYELPRRDSYFVGRREFLETMLNEVASQNTNKNQLFHRNALAQTVGEIVCHICSDNLEKTLTICALALRVIKDRKAHESAIAVQVLTSLLHIRDKHFCQRIKSATTSIFEGLDANSEYEKELLLLLGALHDELLHRSSDKKGPEEEVCFYGIILENLDKIISLFGQNVTDSVKHKILGLVRSLLPIRKATLSFGNSKSRSEKMILLAYSGYSLQGLNYLESEESKERHKLSNNVTSQNPRDEDKMMNYLDEETIKDKIFIALKDLHMSVADAITVQCSKARNDYFVPQGHHGILNHSQLVESSTFFEYFTALRECLTGPGTERRLSRDGHWIHDITEYLLPAFWKIDNGGRNQNRSPADILKGEMIVFFEHLAGLDPTQFINAILDGSIYSSSSGNAAQPLNIATSKTVSDPITKMMEVFITSNNNFDYNNTYMAHFYSLLALLADNNEQFYKAVLNHENWRWALRAFVLNQNVAKSGRLYDVILRNTLKYVEDDEKFRKVIFKTLVGTEGKECFLEQSNPNNAVLKILATIFDSELLHNEENETNLCCVPSFISGECGGMSKISSMAKKVFSQLSETGFAKNPSDAVKLLESLYFCINCMYLIINALDVNDVKKIMTQSWPEVDEVNSIFTQIITRSEDEWVISHQDSHIAKKIVIKIVSISKDLQRLLISASANDGRRQ